jgi:hypothetical protein
MSHLLDCLKIFTLRTPLGGALKVESDAAGWVLFRFFESDLLSTEVARETDAVDHL